MNSFDAIFVGLLGMMMTLPLDGSEDDRLLEELLPALDSDIRSEYLSAGEETEVVIEKEKEVERIRETCRIIRIQLDSDDENEIAVWVGWLSGSHNNSVMFIYNKEDGRWHGLGRILGSHPVPLANRSKGLRDVQTWWHTGSRDGVVTTYGFDGSKYQKTRSEKRKLKGH